MFADNYIAHKKEFNNFGIVELVKIIEYIDHLEMYIDDECSALDHECEITQTAREIIQKLRCENTCPKCGGTLYKSNVSQYDFVCPECDENF